MAKTEHYYTQFEANRIYHVYNRSVDKKAMFKSDENYSFFIRQFDKYLSNYVKIYSYNLLGNHFHFMIKINDLDLNTTLKKSSIIKHKEKTIHEIVSQQFKKFFQSYAMASNKQQNRVGTLFQTPFKRVEVTDEKYLRVLACYINTNAQKHKIVNDFKDWKWSSYNTIISERKTKLLKQDLIDFFDDIDNFIYCNEEYANKSNEVERDFFIED